MNILVVCHRVPFPPDDGGRIGIFNHVRYLALQGHDITLVGISGEPVPKKDLEGLRAYCKPHIFEKDLRNTLPRLAVNLASGTPYTMEKYQFAEVRDFILDLVKTQSFDCVVLEQLHVAWYGQCIKMVADIPLVLVEHNVESQIMHRYAQEQANPLVRIYATLQAKKLRDYEARMVAAFRSCVAISDEDRKTLVQMAPASDIVTVTPGVNLDEFKPVQPKRERVLISVASMEWRPNIEGMIWFCRHVLPRVQQSYPDVRVYIVGKNPPDSIKALAGDGIVVTGWVDDVVPLMEKASAFIVPLQVGSGMRIKILNAFAMGVPVVSTSVGCEGIPVQNDRDILVGDSAEEFAGCAIRLLEDEALGNSLRENALRLIRGQFSMEAKAAELEDILLRAISSRSSVTVGASS